VTLQLRHGRGKGDLGPPVTTGDFTTQNMGGYSGDVMGYTHTLCIYIYYIYYIYISVYVKLLKTKKLLFF
jgi:hypothetical protein